jgi:hypothetical protein
LRCTNRPQSRLFPSFSAVEADFYKVARNPLEVAQKVAQNFSDAPDTMSSKTQKRPFFGRF